MAPGFFMMASLDWSTGGCRQLRARAVMRDVAIAWPGRKPDQRRRSELDAQADLVVAARKAGAPGKPRPRPHRFPARAYCPR